MIQTTHQHYVHPHSRQIQARMPYIRTVNMEQRWQDLANILSLPLSTESDIHNSLHNSIAMVHAPSHHNYQSSNPAFGGIDNRGAILLHNTPLPPSMSDINSNLSSYHTDMEISPVAAAVSSLSTLTNGSEAMGDSSTIHAAAYTGEGGTLLYTHNTTDMNQASDGFLSSILNDEDLQLMDMSMNEGVYNPAERYIQSNQPMPAMYPMRMENDDAMDTSSDSAVSSMGSTERGAPPISEGVHTYCRNNSEWVENGSNSSHHEEQERYYSGIDYSHHNTSLTNKYRPYDYAYPPRHHISSSLNIGANSSLEHRHLPQVAQKKYQLFGKRFPADHAIGGGLYQPNRNPSLIQHVDYPYERNHHQERNTRVPFEMMEGATALDHPDHKFTCNMDFRQNNSVQIGHVQHHHPYQLPSESLVNPQRSSMRDKQKKKSHSSSSSSEESISSRDEKRARALKIPLNTEEIINLPMDEFNERISKFDLTEAQLALIRDIRRRGKNKVAAQNCRKRKLDQILTLAEVVQDLQRNKDDVLRQHENLLAQRQRLQDKYNLLYRHVFQSIRDSDGNSFPSCDYSLQHSANGSMILVPNNSVTVTDPSSGTKTKRKDDNRKC